MTDVYSVKTHLSQIQSSLPITPFLRNNFLPVRRLHSQSMIFLQVYEVFFIIRTRFSFENPNFKL